MPVAVHPVWTIRPNWASDVTERLSWLTDVLRSESGAEQRRKLRLSPRRELEFQVQPHGRERTLFDLAIAKAGALDWWLPLWYDTGRLDAPAAAGASALFTMTGGRALLMGENALLRGPDAFTSEVVSIASVAVDSLTLADPLENDWPAGTKVYPARVARLAQQPTPNRRTSRIATTTLRWELDGPNDWEGAVELDTYAGFPVLAVRPDETQDLSLDYQRILDELDNDTGRSYLTDVGAASFAGQQYRWFAHRRQEHDDLRSLLYQFAGRLNAMWIPTFADDLEVTSSDGDGVITARECGYWQFNGITTRDRLCFRLHGGARLYRQIEAASFIGGEEVLVLDSPLGVAVGQIRQASFMRLCRLDQDTVEIAHRTDSHGVSTVAAMLREAPDIRTAESYTVQTPANTTMDEIPCDPGAGGDGPLSWLRLVGSEDIANPYDYSYGGLVMTQNIGDPDPDGIGAALLLDSDTFSMAAGTVTYRFCYRVQYVANFGAGATVPGINWTAGVNVAAGNEVDPDLTVVITHRYYFNGPSSDPIDDLGEANPFAALTPDLTVVWTMAGDVWTVGVTGADYTPGTPATFESLMASHSFNFVNGDMMVFGEDEAACYFEVVPLPAALGGMFAIASGAVERVYAEADITITASSAVSGVPLHIATAFGGFETGVPP